MTSLLHSEKPDLYSRMPKVDLHRHLEGSLRLDTIMEIVKVFAIPLPMRPDLRSLVQFQPWDLRSATMLFSKLQTLRLLYRTPEIIQRITREAIEDAAREGILYLNLHFTPVALGRYQGFLIPEVMDWVADAARSAAEQFGITVRLVATINRHEGFEEADEVVDRASERISKGIVGLDLAGNEAEFPSEPFQEAFQRARAAGLAIVVHCGEWAGSEMVRQALQDFHADRVIHGVRVLEDPYVTKLAREMGVPFEVCLSSNYYTGVVDSIRQHPFLKMLQAGLNVTLNTDDPDMMHTTLGNEYRLACEELGLPLPILAGRILAAGQAAFLPQKEREQLLVKLENAVFPLMKTNKGKE